MALGPVPEVLDPVDVIPVIDKGLGMFDAHMMELGHVQDVVSTEAVGMMMLSGLIFSRMIGKSVSDRAFGMTAT